MTFTGHSSGDIDRMARLASRQGTVGTPGPGGFTLIELATLQLSEIISSPNNVDVAWLQARGSVSTASQ